MSADGQSGSAVLKRVASLNRSGILAKPLRYGEVKAHLESLGESAALDVLAALEAEGSAAEDPAAFVLASAGGGQGSGGTKRKATCAGSPAVVKRVKLLNASGLLAAHVNYARVGDALGSLPLGQAMTILKALEDAGGSVRDPSGYICAAVEAAGGTVVAEEDEAMEEDDEAEEDEGDAATSRALTRVKREAGQRWGTRPKMEVGVDGRHLEGIKTEDLSDAEQIDRRVQWLNRFANLQAPVELDEVMKALESIGVQQSMRVLRRLEEAAETIDDPNAFVRDLVARSGWIWSKTETIDEDTRVAKRVTWLNQFGGLQQPINYSRVADVLDGLKVMHAMVLLRELETTTKKITDPTAWILTTAGKAGEDEVVIGGTCGSCAADGAIGQRVEALNEEGVLAAPIRLEEVGDGLARIGDEEALRLLQELEDKGPSLKDPTAWLRFKLKAKLASFGTSLEDLASDETKILKRIEWLNDYGGLAKDILYDRVAPSLEAMGLEAAMATLKELEDRRQAVSDPTIFLLDAYAQSVKRRRAARNGVKLEAADAPAAGGGGGGVGALAGFVDVLNRNAGVKKPVRFSEVALALDSLGHKRATQVLQEMQEKGLGLDDPSAYIRAASQRSRLAGMKCEVPEQEDDVAKITKRLKWLNDFGGLAKPIKIQAVIGALYCLGVPQSMSILRGLQERGTGIADPTQYIKGAIQRANGVRVPVKREIEAEEDEPEEEEEDEEVEEQEDDVDDEPAGAGFEPVDGDWEAEEAAELEELVELEEPIQAEAYEEVELEAPLPKKKKEAVNKKKVERRVVGALTGSAHLVPSRQDPVQRAEKEQAGAAPDEDVELFGEPGEAEVVAPAPRLGLPVTPQEKLVAVRNLAVKCGLRLDETCLKAMARLPFYKAKDLIDDVLLGGRNRTGVSNPSRYLAIGVQKMSGGLGVEQGIAMEVAVSLGVVLNNDALDELASIRRKESHAIIREVAKNDTARKDPINFIRAEVQKCRAALESRPFGA